MKKPSLIKRFFSFLLKIVVVLVLMVLIAVGSFEGVTYYLTGSLYDLRDLAKQEIEAENPAGTETESETEVNNKNIKCSVLFVENENGTDDYSILSMINTKSGATDFILIPLHVQVTVVGDLLKDIQEKIPEVGSTIDTDDVSRVFGEEKYQMLTRIYENMTGLTIDQYNVLTQKKFVSLLNIVGDVTYQLDSDLSYRDSDKVLHSMEKGEHSLDGEDAMIIMSYHDGSDKQESARLERSAAYLETWLNKLVEQGKGEEFIEKIEKSSDASEGRDYTEEKKIWENINEDGITVRILQGAETNGVFTIDTQKAKLQIATLIKQGEEYNKTSDDGDSVMSEDDDSDTAASSRGYSIELYNAAYVSGLAGEWEDFLEEQGYSISLIDSYQDEGPISQTRIIVSQEGLGQDLLKYFPNADIQTGDIDTGGDIQVYIGTDSTTVGGESGQKYTGEDQEDEEDEDQTDSTQNGDSSGSYSFDTDSE